MTRNISVKRLLSLYPQLFLKTECCLWFESIFYKFFNWIFVQNHDTRKDDDVKESVILNTLNNWPKIIFQNLWIVRIKIKNWTRIRNTFVYQWACKNVKMSDDLKKQNFFLTFNLA